MPRPSKGPRLYLRAGRFDRRTGKAIPAIYFIRDGKTEVGTGCGPDRLGEAEKQLAGYIGDKWTPAAPQDRPGGPRDPSGVFIAEVIAYYLAHRAPGLASAEGIGFRAVPLLAYWGEKTVADVRRSSCEDYVAQRTKQPLRVFKDAETARLVTAQGARRELEDLSAAIGFFDDEFHLSTRPKVVLPEKPDSPRDALTRAQAARLLRAARGSRLGEDGRWSRLEGSGAANRAHLPRFILIALYTGTRPGVIPRLLWAESPVAPAVDLDTGTIYRRGRDERESRTKRKPLVKVPPRLLAHMKRWRNLDLAEQARRRAADPDAPPIVSVIHHGGLPLANRIRTGFEGIVADAGLPPEITPHWMRHTCATWLMEGGADLWEAAGYTGMTTATLEKHYGHHRAAHHRGAHRALGSGRRT